MKTLVNLDKLPKLLFDARFWILLLFLIRLEGINIPPMDEHSYRQTLTLSVARNFLEWDDNILRPRQLLCDSREGFEVMEFPIYNYLVFLLWKCFGEHNWCFRLLSLVVASAGLWHFYKILRRYVTDRAALAGMVLFGTSIAFIYARKAMPDVFSLSLVLMGVSWGLDYLEKGKLWRLLPFTTFMALGLLSKIPAAAAASLLVIPFFESKAAISRKVWLALAGIIAIACMASWYFVWIPWAEKAYQHQFYFRLGWAKAWDEVINEVWLYTRERFYPIALQSKFAYLFTTFGLAWLLYEKNYRLLGAFLIYFAVFFVFILQVGKTFSTHEYYIIPFVPAIAMITGYGMDKIVIKPWIFLLILSLAAGEGIFRRKSDFVLHWNQKRLLKLEQIADQTIPKDARILIVNYPLFIPQMMYFTHRKGWGETSIERAMDTTWINGEATVGMQYIITDRTRLFQKIPSYPMIYEDNEFRVFKVKKD